MTGPLRPDPEDFGVWQQIGPRRNETKRAIVVLILAFLMVGAPLSAKLALAVSHEKPRHATLLEALEHMEKHIHTMMDALKKGYKPTSSWVEQGLIWDIEHLEVHLDKELELAKKMQR